MLKLGAGLQTQIYFLVVSRNELRTISKMRVCQTCLAENVHAPLTMYNFEENMQWALKLQFIFEMSTRITLPNCIEQYLLPSQYA